MKKQEPEEIVRYEAIVTRPVSKFPEAQTFDCFQRAAERLMDIHQGMTSNRLPEKEIKKVEDSMRITRKVYIGYRNYERNLTMTETPIWSGAMHGMAELKNLVKSYKARESAALFKDNLFVNGDNEQNMLRHFAVIKSVTDDKVKVTLHFNGKKGNAEYGKEDFLRVYHKADCIAKKQFSTELKRYRELHPER